jgi:hypothetical protein
MSSMLANLPEANRAQHEAHLKERALVIDDCKAFLNDACERAGAAYQPGHAGDLAVVALVRHVIEALDGVGLLLSSGSVLPCYPLLRGIFDAWMGVFFILEKDSDDRGAAYFAAQLCQEKAFLERLDPATEKGKALSDELETDIAGPQPFGNVPLQEVRKRIAELQAELDDPLLKPAAQAWASKSKADPAWYSLVVKPNNLRELAKSLNKLSMYELHYRPWCRQVHATDTIANLSSTQDAVTVRPIRHPDGIHEVVRSAGLLAIILAGRLLQNCGPARHAADLQRYKDLEARIKKLAAVKPLKWDGAETK